MALSKTFQGPVDYLLTCDGVCRGRELSPSEYKNKFTEYKELSLVTL